MEFEGAEVIHRTGANITRDLYIFYLIFKDHFFVFKEFLQIFFSLCMVSMQEQFIIKSGYDDAHTLVRSAWLVVLKRVEVTVSNTSPEQERTKWRNHRLGSSL